MDIYVKTHVNLLLRLSREAHEASISIKRYESIAKGISDILNTIVKYHGIFYLRHAVYFTSLKLGHALGPINENIMAKLIKLGYLLSSPSYAPSGPDGPRTSTGCAMQDVQP